MSVRRLFFYMAHPSAKKMSKLDRFLMTNGLLASFPHISAISLDRHLFDHRPILLREVIVDYGATPFHFYHSWLGLLGFDQMVMSTWNSIVLDDSNKMIRFKKKLQILKKEIRAWIAIYNRNQKGHIEEIKSKLKNIDQMVDQGMVRDDILLSRIDLMKQLHDVQSSNNRNVVQKAKKGHIEEIKSKLKNIDQMVDQGMVTDDILLFRMDLMKQLHDVQSSNNRDVVQKAKVRWAIEGYENSKYFRAIINRKRAHLSVKDPGPSRGCLNFDFPFHLNDEQNAVLESPVTRKEILGPDFCMAVEWFFTKGEFAKGCNSSFVALIPKVLDPKVVSDYRPISLIGSLYKVITKILATYISFVMSDLISDVQTTFLPNRQILDGPFIVNEILSRCKAKNHQAMFFKVDFAKAYDSIRWDFLDNVLNSFGFGSKWRSWIRGSLCSEKASILVNGSPTAEFQFHCGLKQRDPLAPFLFFLVMESLHLSSYGIDSSLALSHLFYADDAVFIGEWSNSNLIGIMNILRCFSFLSGMSINIHKSHLLGIRVSDVPVSEAPNQIGCSDESIDKLKKKLSKWKLKTLSVEGRLTLLKAVLGSTPIYNMSLFKVPKQVLSAVLFEGAKSHQLSLLMNLLDTVILSNMEDIWFFALNGDGRFCVKDVRCLLDDVFLPKAE
nr:putative RNA-directed DNA polymerase, eukaryota, reverse transcriptase zinc-binding domain protein [Tanacetum cinerariifolium]